MLKPNTTDAQIIKLMQHPKFPRRPLIIIAKGQGLTKWVNYREADELTVLKRFATKKDHLLVEIARFNSQSKE